MFLEFDNGLLSQTAKLEARNAAPCSAVHACTNSNSVADSNSRSVNLPSYTITMLLALHCTFELQCTIYNVQYTMYITQLRCTMYNVLVQCTYIAGTVLL